MQPLAHQLGGLAGSLLPSGLLLGFLLLCTSGCLGLALPDDGIIRFDTSDSSGGGTFSLLWLLPLALWRRLRRL